MLRAGPATPRALSPRALPGNADLCPVGGSRMRPVPPSADGPPAAAPPRSQQWHSPPELQAAVAGPAGATPPTPAVIGQNGPAAGSCPDDSVSFVHHPGDPWSAEM